MATAKAHIVAADSAACLAMETVIRDGCRVSMEPAVEGALPDGSAALGLVWEVAILDSIKFKASSESPFSHFSPFRRSRNFWESPMASCIAIHCSFSILELSVEAITPPEVRFFDGSGWPGRRDSEHQSNSASRLMKEKAVDAMNGHFWSTADRYVAG